MTSLMGPLFILQNLPDLHNPPLATFAMFSRSKKVKNGKFGTRAALVAFMIIAFASFSVFIFIFIYICEANADLFFFVSPG